MLDPNEKKLKEMFSQEMPKEANERFWDRFDREFGGRNGWDIRWAISSFAVACLVLIVVVNTQQPKPIDQFALIENQELLEDFEFMAEVDEEFLELTDEEWSLLLDS